jgi:hypothetical protein
LEQFRARMGRSLLAANNEDLMREVKVVQQARGWDFTQAWNFVLAEQPAFQRNAPGKAESAAAALSSYATVEARARELMYASGGTLPMGKALEMARQDVVCGSDNPGTPMDPRVAREMNLHKKLDQTRQSAALDDHVGRMAKIRKLMTEKNLTFDAAFTLVCKEETAKTAPATQSLTTSGPTAKVDAESGKTFLVRGIEVGLVTKFGLDS